MLSVATWLPSPTVSTPLSVLPAYANSGLSGTLTVSDGVHAATLTLIGAYVLGNFKLANDGASGTLVTDPPISSGAGIAAPH